MSGLDLSSFVSATLTNVVEAVESSNQSARSKGASINPAAPEQMRDTNFPTLIDFDVAVTVEERGGAETGLSIKVLGIGGDLKGGLQGAASSVTRIRFTLPVQLPRGPNLGWFDPKSATTPFNR
jgi:hypothetical protein